MAVGIALLFFLVILNGFFVAAEFAIIKVRYSQIEAEAAAGGKLAKVTKDILDNLDSFISAVQVGVTFASLALGWLGEPIIARLVESLFLFFGIPPSSTVVRGIALPVGLAIISTFHLIFGELVPKYIALTFPQAVAYVAAYPLRIFAIVCTPLVWFINASARAFLRPFGIRVGEEEESHTEDELRLLLAESAQSGERGTIKKTEHELIERVFHFDERVVRQIMVPRTRVVMVSQEASTDEIFSVMVKEGYTRMPVYSGSKDNIVGIVHSKDLLRLIRVKQSIHLEELLRPAYFVPETKRIAELLREFQHRRIHMAIVVDEFGVVSGLVTLEDIVEELVGEIQDEYDEEMPVVERKSETTWIVNAHAPVVDVNAYLPHALPEGPEYSTVAGFVMTLFSIIPEVGQSKVYAPYKITVLKRSKRSVELIQMELHEPG